MSRFPSPEIPPLPGLPTGPPHPLDHRAGVRRYPPTSYLDLLPYGLRQMPVVMAVRDNESFVDEAYGKAVGVQYALVTEAYEELVEVTLIPEFSPDLELRLFTKLALRAWLFLECVMDQEDDMLRHHGRNFSFRFTHYFQGVEWRMRVMKKKYKCFFSDDFGHPQTAQLRAFVSKFTFLKFGYKHSTD
jgi:hypothetical protein